MLEFLGQILSWLFIAFFYVVAVIYNSISNPFFWIILVAGIGWFIWSSKHNKTIPEEEEEKKKKFAQVRLIGRIIFWVAIAAVCIVANIFAGPIGFM